MNQSFLGRLWALSLSLGDTLAAEAPFFVILLPLITVVGGGFALYFGLRGVLKQSTYAMFKRETRTTYKVAGGEAIFVGVLHLLIFALVILLLAPASLRLLGLL